MMASDNQFRISFSSSFSPFIRGRKSASLLKTKWKRSRQREREMHGTEGRREARGSRAKDEDE